jgi:hypothetical protein
MSSEAPCRTTHPQILAGNCPWCGTEIGARSQADAPEERRWDIPRLKADLNRKDDEAPMITIQNVEYHGRLALVEGDVERATSYLLASAETAGCPLWCSTFRSMVLAKELLGRGERETVLRFLERCSALWPEFAKWLTQRAAAIERGETPIFVPWT